jgi:hypothetical protein
MINFSQTTFKRIIIHDIFQKRPEEQNSSVKYSNRLFIVDDEVEEMLKQRLNDACGKQSKSFDLEIVNTQEGSFFRISLGLLAGNDDEFVEYSKRIASRLGSSQKRSNIPGGYLLILDGEVLNESGDGMNGFVVVVKAELQQAFRSSNDEEHNISQIEVLKDIFLSPADNFFKIGLLRETSAKGGDYPNDRYGCLIHDDQFRPGGDPDEFFYQEFLGFSKEKNAKLLSRDFFRMTKQIIETHGTTPEEKQDCMAALKTLYKRDQRQHIDPYEFGERYLTGAMKEQYETNVLGQPRFDRPFVKDLTHLRGELKKRVMRFRHHVNIVGPEETFNDNVRVVKTLEEAASALEQPEDFTLLKINGVPYENG